MFDIYIKIDNYSGYIDITLKKEPFKINFKQKDVNRFLDHLGDLLKATKKEEFHQDSYSSISTSNGIVQIFIGNSYENSKLKLQNKEGIRLLEDMIEKIHEI